MIEAMLKIVMKKEYQAGYPKANGEPATHCNEAAVEIIETLGFDSSPFLHKKGVGWTNANDMYRNAREAVLLGKLEEVTEKQAILLANNKECVLVASFSLVGGSGHVAIVAPETFPYDKGTGCAIVQAGVQCGRFTRKEIFDVSNLTPPVYIRCRRKK